MAKKTVKNKTAPKKKAANVKKKPAVKAKAKKPATKTLIKVTAKAAPRPEVKTEVASATKALAPQVIPTPVAPTRAPVKRVVNVTPSAQKIAERVIITVKTEPVAAPAKVNWNELPKYLPAQLRFLISSCFKECEKAKGSPFPFAKFISTLPESQCGLEFSMLVLSLEHDREAISKLCRLSPEQVDRISENASANFVDKFSSLCGDMCRKLGTQLAGSGIDVDTLVGKYTIPGVDNNFQTMLGAVILKSMGAKTINYQPIALAC